MSLNTCFLICKMRIITVARLHRVLMKMNEMCVVAQKFDNHVRSGGSGIAVLAPFNKSSYLGGRF